MRLSSPTHRPCLSAPARGQARPGRAGCRCPNVGGGPELNARSGGWCWGDPGSVMVRKAVDLVVGVEQGFDDQLADMGIAGPVEHMPAGFAGVDQPG